MIAVLINKKDIEQRIRNEQNGYKNVDSLPDYRYLRGSILIDGFLRVLVNRNKQKHFLKCQLWNLLHELMKHIKIVVIY